MTSGYWREPILRIGELADDRSGARFDDLQHILGCLVTLSVFCVCVVIRAMRFLLWRGSPHRVEFLIHPERSHLVSETLQIKLRDVVLRLCFRGLQAGCRGAHGTLCL